jgi:hypothetical protein
MRLRAQCSTVTNQAICAFMLLLAIGFQRAGYAAGANDSLEKAWTAHAQAQCQLQQELAKFFISRRPDLKERFELNRDLQLALIDRRSMEFRYLLATHPEKIVRDQGISRLANYEWTDEDQNALRRSSPEYEAARKRVEELRKRSEETSQGHTLRDAQQALAKDPELLSIYQRFEEREQAAQKMLEAGR